MNKIWLGIAVLALVIIAAVWLIMAPAPSPSSTNTTQSGKIVPVWKFTDKGEDPSTHAQMTMVTLTLGETTYDAGTYSGTCAEIGADGGVDGKGLVEGEVSGVQCWFAGGGDEIGLFEQNGTLTLKKGQLEEPQGEGISGFRGNFTTIVSIGA